MKRRNFLGKAGMGAAGAVATFLFPGLRGFAAASRNSGLQSGRQAVSIAGDRPAANVHQIQGVDTSYAGGEVTAKTADGIVLKSPNGARAVHIAPDAVVWKEFNVGLVDIAIGDWVDVKGTPQPDGSLVGQSGWIFVNIGKREGVVQAVSPSGMSIQHNKGSEAIEFSPALEVIQAGDQSPLPGGVTALVPGTQVGMVGLRLPGGGFRATRIWR